MSPVSVSAPSNATLRFVVLYLLTVGLIVAIFSAFRERGPAGETSQSPTGGDSLSGFGAGEAEVEAVKSKYKEELEKRDQAIALLQSENRMLDSLNRNAVPVIRTVEGGDGEWRQRFAAVKANYDKLLDENNALEKSYQTLADDNRRLVSQLRKSSSNQ